jgi:hypothetical protein
MESSPQNLKKSVRQAIHIWPWIVIGAGCFLALGLAVIGNALLIGDRLGRVNTDLEATFYFLLVGLFYLLFLHPLVAIAIRPRMLIHPFLNRESIISPGDAKSAAKRIWRNGNLDESEKRQLKVAWRNEDALALAVRTIFLEKHKSADMLIQKHAQMAFISTAVSQNGSLDGVMLAYTNMKLIRAMVEHYACRPSFSQLMRMYSQVLACALVAQRLEDVELEDIFPQLGASVGGGVASWVPGLQFAMTALLQGLGSAFLTLRTGMLAKQYIVAGGTDFDVPTARKTASREAAKMIWPVILEIATRLPKSLRLLLNILKSSPKEPVKQNV